MKPVRRFVLMFVVVAAGLPIAHTAWVSFSPDSVLTPPTADWSLRWYRRFVDDERWWSAGLFSLVVAVTTGLTATAAALGAVTVLRGRRRSRSGPHSGGRWLDRTAATLILLPAVVPAVAVAVGSLPLLHRLELWGEPLGLIAVHAVLGLPIAYLIIEGRWTESIDAAERTARGLGASPGTAFRRVTLPLLRPALMAAVAAVFVLSLNESLVTVFLAGPRTETLPALCWPELRFAPTPVVAVAACLSAIPATIGTAAALAWGMRGEKDSMPG